MRIERCSDSELHCFLSREDLEARNLRLDSLAYGNPETTALIHDLMNWATYKFNFNPDHIPLMIEAVPVTDDSLLIIVKTVSYPEEMDSRFSDFLDSPQGDVYMEDDDGFDEEDEDFWPDDGDDFGYPPYGPLPSPVPKNVPGAHEIIGQFSDNAQVLKEASEAIGKLTEGVLAAAGETDAGKTAVGKDTSEKDRGDGDSSAKQAGEEAAEAGAGTGDQEADSSGSDARSADTPADENIPVSGDVVDAAELAAAPAGGSGDRKGAPVITAENFAEVLQKVLEAARKSGSSSNYIRMFRFNSIDELAKIAPFLSSFYQGANYLYKDGAVFHLLVSMDGESPLNYNKLINVLNEFAVPEPVNVETTSFLDEHDNLILAGHAVQKLAEVSKG